MKSHSRMSDAFEGFQVRVESCVQFLRPAQTSWHARHVLVERHLSSALTHLHGLVVDLLARQDVGVHNGPSCAQLPGSFYWTRPWWADVEEVDRGCRSARGKRNTSRWCSFNESWENRADELRTRKMDWSSEQSSHPCNTSAANRLSISTIAVLKFS